MSYCPMGKLLDRLKFFVKTKDSKKELGTVFYSELFGKRSFKYEILTTNDMTTIHWKKVKQTSPYYFFVPKDFSGKRKYEKGFRITELMKVYVSGFQTKRDNLTIHFNTKALQEVKYLFQKNGIYSKRFRFVKKV